MPSDIKEIYRRISMFCTLGIELGLEYTPLECLNVSGFTKELIFWIALPFIILPFIFIGTYWWLRLQGKPAGFIIVLERAAPFLLQFLFLVYPILTRKAFQAFPCHDFDTGISFLRADVRIVCGSEEHTQAQIVAVLAILLYPIGQFAAFALLLYMANDAVNSGTPSRLSKATDFLHRDYKPQFHW